MTFGRTQLTGRRQGMGHPAVLDSRCTPACRRGMKLPTRLDADSLDGLASISVFDLCPTGMHADRKFADPFIGIPSAGQGDYSSKEEVASVRTEVVSDS